MSEKILVPELGESITEATVSKWLKKVGDSVEVDEAIVELETDKVNLEVPSPISGILSEMNSKDGDTVEVGAVLGSVSNEKSNLEKKSSSKQDIKKEGGKAFEKAMNWYTSGPRQRLQPGGVIVVVMTRWSTKDITGELIKAQSEEGSDQWEVIELPAILPSGEALWSEFWKLEELEALRAELPNSKWQSQYQQDPTSEEGALVKREWWQTWEERDPPECEFVIQSWDTAFMKNQRADYSACTTWGVFYRENDEGMLAPNVILLDAYKARLEFPELKVKAVEKHSQYKPDAFIVEAKAAGMPLIFELRQAGIPV